MITSCPGHYEPSDFDLNALEKAGPTLLLIKTDGSLQDKELWPDAVKDLKPKSVYKTERGVYIMLDSFYVEESGIFFPVDGFETDNGLGEDQTYIKLINNVYSYYRR
ncbi:MAG: hypothetical protein D6B28_07140 [Gammaproteobacteria bacterium]|nr:MAG: hypothetical protein D6B28_07140 [Gammaproteobacteria bacterium]